jgi:asparagine synthase (glutamine-hydrolysing)
VAQAIGTQHQELVLTEQRFIAQLDAALDSLDQPTFDGLNSYYMSHAVREAGFKVALVGSGGDELFGGYTSFRDLPRLMAWSRRAQVLPMRWRVALADAVSAAMQRPGAKMPRQTRWAKLPQLVRRGEDVLALYQMAYALFLPSFQQQLLGEAARGALCDGLPAVVHERLRGEIGERGALEAISTLEHRLFLGERLLRDTDAASMAVSIEVRLPLVDQVLLECVNRMPAQQRFQPLRTKAALRRSGLRGLDPGLFQQSKAGFELPLEHWLRSSLGHRIDGTMRDTHSVAAAGLDPATVRRLWQAFRERAPGLYWTRVWALYVHIRWCQRHGVAV